MLTKPLHERRHANAGETVLGVPSPPALISSSPSPPPLAKQGIKMAALSVSLPQQPRFIYKIITGDATTVS